METVQKYNQEIADNLSDPGIKKALMATTFKGLSEQTMKQAIFEAMARGFSFKDFLEKNIYAIPFSNSYTLVTSIDYARKVGMRSGIVGKSAPVFIEDKNGIVSCTVTVKRRVNGYVGDFSQTVYFSEYSTGRNLWKTKPHTMIAKVAEMHALRMSCPEEMSQIYVQEEYEADGEQPKKEEVKRSKTESEVLLKNAMKVIDGYKDATDLQSNAKPILNEQIEKGMHTADCDKLKKYINAQYESLKPEKK